MRLLTALVAVAVLALAIPAADFPLKDGDVWVMAGDSITAQHLHSNYFEAFCYARYPKLTFAFRNSGVGGHTIPTTLARFEYDVAAWAPTVVSVELGMNDQGGFTPEQYLANMGKMVDRIKGVKARAVMFTASPINNGDTMTKLGGNRRLNDYAVGLKAFAVKENLPFADQFHPLLDVWGKNKPREQLANALPVIRGLVKDESVAGAEHLRSFLAAQEASKDKPVSMQGDPVHPGPHGQLMMAAALLKDLGADPFVGAATLDAGGKVVEVTGCRVDEVKVGDGTLSFDRLDDRLPFPIPDDARAVLAFDPTILDLSRYTLTVTGLKQGSYTLKVNDAVLAGSLTAEELAKGVNLTGLAFAAGAVGNPIAAQGKAILAAVAAKEQLVGQWRGLSQRAHAAGAVPDLKTQLAESGKKVATADAKIREAAKPQKMRFELTAK